MRRRRPFPNADGEVFAAVIRAYMTTSPKWTLPPPKGYSDATKDSWRRQLNLAARPEVLGSVPISELRPSLVQAFLDALADRPGKAEKALSALKQLEKWACVRDRIPHPFTTGCEVEGSDGGHIPWTDAQVALAEQHATSDLARVVTLAVNTGQRGSDLVKMRWSEIETITGRPGINVTQRKTGKKLWVPFTQELMVAAERWERRPGFILLNKDKPWTRNALSTAWGRHRDDNEKLKPLSGLVLHGLRATACVRLNHAGANELQISDMIGMSLEMVKRYLRFSVQTENALAAVGHLDAKLLAFKSLK